MMEELNIGSIRDLSEARRLITLLHCQLQDTRKMALDSVRPAQATPVNPARELSDEETLDLAKDAVSSSLGDAYDCMRVWSAWSYGTMTEDDFRLVSDDPERVHEIAQAVIDAIAASAAPAAPVEHKPLSDEEIELIGMRLLWENKKHEWKGLPQWVYDFARAIEHRKGAV